MFSDSLGQLNGSHFNIKSTHIRFDVSDKVKAQVVDSEKGNVIREVPHQYSSNILKGLYA